MKHEFEKIQKLLWDYAPQRTLTTASRCGILQRLARSAATVETVSEGLNLSKDATDKVVRALVAMEILERKGETFELIEDFKPFFSGGSEDLSPFLEHSHWMYENWGASLETWLRSGKWPRRERSLEEIRVFAKAMRAIGRQTARTTLDQIDLEEVRSVLDIGGSLGHWAEEFCRRVPGLKATVFDIPENAEAGREAFRDTEFEDRISFLGGDYLSDDFGAGYDLALLANILHQEHAAAASRLIRRAADSLSPGGRLCVVDFRIDEDRCSPLFGTLFTIHMRDFGNTWTEKNISGWMRDAGLEQIERKDLNPSRWLISGRKI